MTGPSPNLILLKTGNWDSVKSPVSTANLEIKTCRAGMGLLFLAMCTQRSKDDKHDKRTRHTTAEGRGRGRIEKGREKQKIASFPFDGFPVPPEVQP